AEAHGRHAGAEPAHDAEPRPADVGEAVLGEHRERHPDVGADAGLDAVETFAHHPDDLESLPAKTHGAAQRRGVAVELPHPETVAQDRDRAAAEALIVFGSQEAAQRRRTAEPAERVAG